MSGTTPKKTKYCTKCHERHDVSHAHFKDAPDDKSTNTVTGSTSAQDLAEQASKGRPQDIDKKRALLLKEKEAEEERRRLLMSRWGRRMRWMFSTWSYLADDEKLRLTDREVNEEGEVFADLCMVWGFETSTKLEATFDVLALNATLVAARTDLGNAILEKIKGKKGDANAEPDPALRAGE